MTAPVLPSTFGAIERLACVPVHEIVLMVSSPRTDADGRSSVLENGSLHPAAVELKAGERYRLWLVDIHTRGQST